MADKDQLQTELMESLNRAIIDNRGAIYEGDVFSILKRSPYTVRSFEFALADGALECDHEFDPECSWADRFWQTDQRHGDPVVGPSRLMLFDVKSKTAQLAGEQICVTTAGQKACVAFYITICAADPSFVELIPNLQQGLPPLDSIKKEDRKRALAVNESRASRLVPPAYKLDPGGSPYRMPLALLPEAVRRVRACASSAADASVPHYINPWTNVVFPDWHPKTVVSTPFVEAAAFLKPEGDTGHYSAFLAAMEVYRHCNLRPGGPPMRVDFVGLQPRLADFKVIITDPETHRPRQFFVQHKLDSRDRALNNRLEKVQVARKQGHSTRYYFSASERSVPNEPAFCAVSLY